VYGQYSEEEMPGTLKLKSEAGGSVILAANTTASSDLTVTVPASTGTMMVSPQLLTVPNTTGSVMVSGNMPAFSVYRNASQSVPSGSATKIQFDNRTFDTNNYFDITTNYRYLPLVAGYYQISACCTLSSTISGNPYVNGYLYKNNGGYARTANSQPSNGNYYSSYINTLVYLNGSTDYLEFYAEQVSGSSATVILGASWTWFTGVMIRGT
jgi:hypothetical protein